MLLCGYAVRTGATVLLEVIYLTICGFTLVVGGSMAYDLKFLFVCLLITMLNGSALLRDAGNHAMSTIGSAPEAGYAGPHIRHMFLLTIGWWFR